MTAYELAKEYHETCETFDRTVCTGAKGSVAMPMNGRELGCIGKHAQGVRMIVEAKAARDGISMRELCAAISYYGRTMNYDYPTSGDEIRPVAMPAEFLREGERQMLGKVISKPGAVIEVRAYQFPAWVREAMNRVIKAVRGGR